MAGFIALALGGPFISFLLSPFYLSDKKQKFVKVPGFNALPPEQPTKMVFPYIQKDSFLTQNQTLDVWVVKHSPMAATVYSPMCTHLGCQYDWKGDQQQFVCPCHASIFDPSGKVTAGPAPRPLDMLPYKIENGELFVQWEVYKPGTSKKIEA